MVFWGWWLFVGGVGFLWLRSGGWGVVVVVGCVMSRFGVDLWVVLCDDVGVRMFCCKKWSFVVMLMRSFVRGSVCVYLLGVLAAGWLAEGVIPAPQRVSECVTDVVPRDVEGAYVLRLRRSGDGEPVWSVQARNEAGRFYAEQTRLQLLREYGDDLPEVLEVEDFPRLPWRGLHLDVSRHWFTVAEVKALMDRMAALKLNRLHLHLTDGPGWRMEVKAFPRLTSVGAWRQNVTVPEWDWRRMVVGRGDGVLYGGFFTQQDLRELVAYGRERHIVIVPEVDFPGHSYAAMLAYPELLAYEGFNFDKSCAVGGDALDIDNPETLAFACAVFDEVLQVFPGGTPVHVGGDEVQVFSREKQRVWMQRLVDYLRSRGREVIAWDETAMNGVRGQTVMVWHADQLGSLERYEQPVILTPTSHCYFDFRQSESESEPLAMGRRVIRLRDVFDFEVPAFDHVVGLQGNLWTEYIRGFDHLLYMAFPRAAALAERAWGSPRRPFEVFVADLQVHPQFVAEPFTREQQRRVAESDRTLQPEEMEVYVRRQREAQRCAE